MPIAYLNDLRLRIVKAFLAGKGTRAEMATQFHVSPVSVNRFVRRYRQTNSVAPAPHNKGPQPPLLAWLQQNSALTQTELTECYNRHTDRPVSQRTISRVLRRMSITRKISPFTRHSESERR